MLAWRRQNGQNNGQILQGSPFQLSVSFTPSAVVGDTATPGFLSNSAAETPGAVPSLYGSKYGQWTLPYSVTFYRAPSAGDTNPLFGSVRFTVRLVSTGNGLDQQLEITRDASTGIFTADQPYYWLYDQPSGKFIIHTANLTFQMDPARGRVETAFPPLATTNGVPLYRVDARSQAQPLTAGAGGNSGTLVSTLYRKPTLDAARAGKEYPAAGSGRYVPINQGIIAARLDEALYYDSTTAYPSLFAVFGSSTLNPFGGLLIVAGSEKVVGPDNNLSQTGNNTYQPVTYFRVPALTGSIRKTASIVGEAGNAQRYYLRNGLLNYRLETDLEAYRSPFLQFDEAAGFIALDPSTYDTQDSAAGMPAAAAGGTASEVQVSYLWQNNYARNRQGEPVNAGGVSVVGDPTARSNPRPEADVVKVDYSTRSQINVVLGARVYDTSTGTPQAAQVTDKVVVTNANR